MTDIFKVDVYIVDDTGLNKLYHTYEFDTLEEATEFAKNYYLQNTKVIIKRS